jgi:hypothetical protein
MDRITFTWVGNSRIMLIVTVCMQLRQNSSLANCASVEVKKATWLGIEGICNRLWRPITAGLLRISHGLLFLARGSWSSCSSMREGIWGNGAVPSHAP